MDVSLTICSDPDRNTGSVTFATGVESEVVLLGLGRLDLHLVLKKVLFHTGVNRDSQGRKL